MPRFPSGLGGALSPPRSTSFRQPVVAAPGEPGNSLLREGAAEGRMHLVVGVGHFTSSLERIRAEVKTELDAFKEAFKAEMLSLLGDKLAVFPKSIELDCSVIVQIKQAQVEIEAMVRKMALTLKAMKESAAKAADATGAIHD
jgi:hypothetical protein